jgi:hypothetical protein
MVPRMMVRWLPNIGEGVVVRVWGLWHWAPLLVGRGPWAVVTVVVANLAIPVPRKFAYVLLLQGVAAAIVIVLCLIEEVAGEAFALKSR